MKPVICVIVIVSKWIKHAVWFVAAFYFLLPSLLFSFYLHDCVRLRACSVSLGSQIPPPPPSLLHGGQLARNYCTVLEYVCPPVTFDTMSGTLRYNCSSQHWSATDLTSCSGALYMLILVCNRLWFLILYSGLVFTDAVLHTLA